jgi:hypothetical protein
LRNKTLTDNPLQPIKQLSRVLASLADEQHSLFALSDLRAALPNHTPGAFRAVIMRAEQEGLIERVCRGVYRYPAAGSGDGLVLYRVAARLRAGDFNYISLESALSDAGIISQIPTHRLTLMSGGRTAIIPCGKYGAIEFVHTKKQPAALADQLTFDYRCRLWRASVALALSDLKATRRDLDMVNWEAIGDAV